MIAKPRSSAKSQASQGPPAAKASPAEGPTSIATESDLDPDQAQEQEHDRLPAEADVEADVEAEAEIEAQPRSGAEPDSPPDSPLDGEEAGEQEALDEGDTPDERPLRYRVEAVLFACGDTVTPARLAAVLSVPQDRVRAALAELKTEWAERQGAVDLMEIAGGWRFMTRPSFHADLAGLARKGGIEKLSPAALETLAIVAYRQPLTRSEIEAVRGVQAGPLLRVLLDRDLIRVSGRSTEPGHPLLYGTTKRFLDHFGLKSLKNLPDLKDLLD